MFGSHFKAAWRNIWMNRWFSCINIAGLSIGLAASFMIVLFSMSELSYDAYNTKLDSIFLVTSEHTAMQGANVMAPFVLGPSLKNECPEIQEYARFMRGRAPVKFKEQSFEREYCLSADLSIFKILTWPLRSGSLPGPESERDFIILSSRMAQKVFGKTSPIGQIVSIDWLGRQYSLRVAAVMENVPQNATLRTEMVVPLHIAVTWFPSINGGDTGFITSWKNDVFPTYVLMSKPSTQAQRETLMASFTQRHIDPAAQTRFHLFPLKDLYYNPTGLLNNVFPSGKMSLINIYSAIGIIILLIACLNFVILSTGRSNVRSKEMAVRKLVGASRSSLIGQIMVESLTIAAISLPIALLLVELTIPTLSRLMGSRVPDLTSYGLKDFMIYGGITLLAGVISGGYVAYHLSSFSPLESLRSKVITGASKATLRKVMIGMQMVVFIGLLTASFVIQKQMQYFHNKDLGFDKNNVIVLDNTKRIIQPIVHGATLEALKSDLRNNPAVVSVAAAQRLPGVSGGTSLVLPLKADPSRLIHYDELCVDREFIETMKMKLVAGRTFAQAAPEEAKNGVILNESAVRAFELTDPSKETIGDRRILGVVRDFNMGSLREEIPPMVLRTDTTSMHEIAVRVRTDADVGRAVSSILTCSSKYNEGVAMDFQFFDDRLDDLYGSDHRFAWVIGYFTLLAIVITSLGLFGVSLFVVHTRVKEIGVRKVMGASLGSLVYLVGREFLMLTVIATAIAVPISQYFVGRWLQSFAYAVSMDVWIVLVTLLSALVVVFGAIGYQAYKAARANPVEALRHE